MFAPPPLLWMGQTAPSAPLLPPALTEGCVSGLNYICRGEPSKTPQVPKTPHARFSEVPDPTHFFNLPGKQKSFGENTVKV